jgi:nicotinamidase-related amidase
MSDTALIIIDMQNDYFPEGRFALPGMEDAAKRAADLLEYFRRTSKPVFHVRHIELDESATFFIPNTDGIEIHSSVAPQSGERVIDKHYPNGFKGTELFKELVGAGISNLVICGAMSNMCIDATVRAGSDGGFNCMVAWDACAASEVALGDREVEAEQVHLCFMGALASAYARVMTTDECIKALETDGS